MTMSTPTGPSGSILASTGYDTPTFSWGSVGGATLYDLYLKDTTTGALVFNNTNVSGTTFTPSMPLIPGHSYVWYIGAEGAAGTSGAIAWSGATSFSLASLKPPTTLVAPAAASPSARAT